MYICIIIHYRLSNPLNIIRPELLHLIKTIELSNLEILYKNPYERKSQQFFLFYLILPKLSILAFLLDVHC